MTRRSARCYDKVPEVISCQAYWSEPFIVPIPGTTGGRNFGHRRIFNGQPPKKLSYRGVQPLFEGSEFSVNANDNADGMALWTANADGQPTMKGTATW